jgi:hypothetical protein
MNDPAVLWPWPGWMAALAPVAIVVASWMAAQVAMRPRNRRAARLAEQLRESGLHGAGTFTVDGDKNSVVVAGVRVAIVDRREGRIVQIGNLDDTTGLKVYDVAAESIPFRLIGRNGAQSRKVITRSVVGFAQLFERLAGASKRIEYIEE